MSSTWLWNRAQNRLKTLLQRDYRKSSAPFRMPTVVRVVMPTLMHWQTYSGKSLESALTTVRLRRWKMVLVCCTQPMKFCWMGSQNAVRDSHGSSSSTSRTIFSTSLTMILLNVLHLSSSTWTVYKDGWWSILELVSSFKDGVQAERSFGKSLLELLRLGSIALALSREEGCVRWFRSEIDASKEFV